MLYSDKDIVLYSSPQGKDKQIIELNANEMKKNTEIARRIDHVKTMLSKMSRGDNEEGQDKNKEEGLQV